MTTFGTPIQFSTCCHSQSACFLLPGLLKNENIYGDSPVQQRGKSVAPFSSPWILQFLRIYLTFSSTHHLRRPDPLVLVQCTLI
jgi:hypothetical protein